MPRKKCTKKSEKPVDKTMSKTGSRQLHCEWNNCIESVGTMDGFLSHVDSHIAKYYNNLRAQHADGFTCEWRGCGSQVSGNVTDFNRHVYFHAFHVKVKNAGVRIVESLGIESCKLDNQSRNLIPELPERLQCEWTMCEVVYDNPEYFYRHLDKHACTCNMPGGCPCQWKGCEVVVKDKHKLKEHLRSHTQEKTVACPVCGALFSTKAGFVDHLKRQDKDKVDVQWYGCSYCKKRFTTARLLREHVRYHVNNYKCSHCDMTCATPSGLRSHFRYRHTNDRPYKCDQCAYACKSTQDLRRHKYSHLTMKMFQCRVTNCTFRTNSLSTLEDHFRKSHQGMEETKFACHMCDSVFSLSRRFTRHLKQVHNFTWASGHKRFRYVPHEDGFLRLQTVRYESSQMIELNIDPSSLVAPSNSEIREQNVVPTSSNDTCSSS